MSQFKEILQDLLKKAKQQPTTYHTNVSLKMYPVSIKHNGILFTLQNIKQDILSIRYITKNEYPMLWIRCDGKILIQKDNWYGELLDVSYLPIQPFCISNIHILTDRKTEGTLVITYADRENNNDFAPHYVVNKTKTSVVANIDGQIEFQSALNTIRKVRWNFSENPKEQVLSYIETEYIITGKEKDRCMIKEFIKDIRNAVPEFKEEIEPILLELGIQKKRYTSGICFVGITRKEEGVFKKSIYDRIDDRMEQRMDDRMDELKQQYQRLKRAFYLYITSIPTNECIEKEILPLIV